MCAFSVTVLQAAARVGVSQAPQSGGILGKIKNMGNLVKRELDTKNTLKTTSQCSLSRKINNSAIFSSSETFLQQYHEWFKSYCLLQAFYVFLKTITFNQYIQIVIIIEIIIFI